MPDLRTQIANNARSLLKDAELLHVAERYRSSIVLSIIAIEEVGKIIEQIVWDEEKQSRKEWHKKKQYNVGLLLSAQICSRVIGENVDLPKNKGEDIYVEERLAEIFFPVSIDEKPSGKELGEYLFFKSNGKVDSYEIRKINEYEQLLIQGRLNRIKNQCLYVDQAEEENDPYELSNSILYIARAAVQMCRNL